MMLFEEPELCSCAAAAILCCNKMTKKLCREVLILNTKYSIL